MQSTSRVSQTGRADDSWRGTLRRAADLFTALLQRRYWQERFVGRGGVLRPVEDHLDLAATIVRCRTGAVVPVGRWLRAAWLPRFRSALRPGGRDHVVSHARQVWTLAHLLRNGPGPARPGDRDVLEARTRHLVERFLDPDEGGFFWRRAADGRLVDGSKMLYGQAFAILSLVEAATALGDAAGVALARSAFRRVHRALHDPVRGGWHEVADRSFVPRGPGLPVVESGFRAIPGGRSLNGHLHWMEALSALHRVCNDAEVAEALEESLTVTRTRFSPASLGGCTSFRDANWQPVPGRANEVLYGHLLELAWLSADAEVCLGRAPNWGLVDELVDEALRFGFDGSRGGFHLSGPPGGAALRRDKFWWVQAEGLVALLDRVRRPHHESQNAAFSALVDWIERHQLDRHRGVWLWATDELGRPSNFVLAGSWKAGYHEVRAMCRIVAAAREDVTGATGVVERAASAQGGGCHGQAGGSRDDRAGRGGDVAGGLPGAAGPE